MSGALILCGGTGAHTGVAFLRLHTLGYALGFFDQGVRAFDFPTIYLVDQDAADGARAQATAWQEARRLVSRHPGRQNWFQATGRPEGPDLLQITPLPVGSDQKWYEPPYDNLATRFASSLFLPLLTSDPQRRIAYSKGMMGSPAVGSLLFRLKSYDEAGDRLNYDQVYKKLLEEDGRIVVAGSGVGGTGASVGPTLAKVLADRERGPVMAVMILSWFLLNDDGDEERREKAARRNRLMRENASSALEFYGKSLAESVAAVPVGMPERSLIKRDFTGDMGQPIQESYVHAVGALSAYRHFLRQEAYGPGLYIMGAVEKGRLDGATAIPGGTLQDIANQGATLVHTLEAFAGTLGVDHSASRVRPAIFDKVAAISSNSGQISELLRSETAHYRDQLKWMEDTLNIKPQANTSFSYEARSRRRLGDGRKPLPVSSGNTPDEIVSALFQWAADWVRAEATRENGLRVAPGGVLGGHWPDIRNMNELGVAPEQNGDLTRISDGSRAAVLEAFVDRTYLSANGWPHPLAGVDFFRQSIKRLDPIALRQLELLLLGIISKTLRIDQVREPVEPIPDISLENLIMDYRRNAGFPTVGEYCVVYPEAADRVIGLSSPYTLLCPVPFMNEEDDNHIWNDLWRKLSGATDGAPWREAKDPGSWGADHDLMIFSLRSWISQQRQVHSGMAPPWTKVFERERFTGTIVPFGAGRQLRVFWGAAADANGSLIALNLPTIAFDYWDPPVGTELIDENEFEVQVPELRRLEGAGGVELYSKVELEVPGREAPLRGWWREHLTELQKTGKIQFWGQSRIEADALNLAVYEEGRLMAVHLSNSRLLDQRSVVISKCLPLRQDPVPGSTARPGENLYPNLPIKGDYVDLVVPGAEGLSCLQLLKQGSRWNTANIGPEASQDSQGGEILRWSLPCKGRQNSLNVEVRLSPEQVTSARSAHWMVWPNFRTNSRNHEPGWRTYYVFTHTKDIFAQVDAMWLDADRDRTRWREGETGDQDYAVYPIKYLKTGGIPHHAGGPPLAFRLRHKDEEAGLYPIFLEQVAQEVNTTMDLAVDFGTSHSVASLKIGGADAQVVELRPELQRADGNQRPLTHHVSEDMGRVMSSSDGEGGIVRSGEWMPTYYEGPARSFIPSELTFRKPLSPSDADNLADWVPGKDYRIPSMAVGKERLAEFLLADFKWDPDNQVFVGRERELREHYLALFLEIVLADVVRTVGGMPTRQINVTFTYPLRTPSHEVEHLTETFQRSLERVALSTGLPLELHDGVGILDESRAAKLPTRNPGEVGLVADLGGGTLDVFISAHAPEGRVFPELADSARLGANLLLRQIAQNADRYLPSDGKWKSSGDSRETEVKLRSWMRSKGAEVLFGQEAQGRPELPDFGVTGFAQPKQAGEARKLIGRYFRLVAEFMARSLTAYLVNHWYPKASQQEQERLRISVQLRGNGWRMDYSTSDYTCITQRITDLVRERVFALWDSIDGPNYPKPEADGHWVSASEYSARDPKTAPVLSVAGVSKPFQEVRDSWHSHTLVDLEVQTLKGEIKDVPWWTKIPFYTGGSQDVGVRELRPPLVLSHKNEEIEYRVRLTAVQVGIINRRMSEEEGFAIEGDFRAPVSAIVWETVFRDGGLSDTVSTLPSETGGKEQGESRGSEGAAGLRSKKTRTKRESKR